MDPRGHVAEENVESKVVEERHADREQQEPREQRFDHRRHVTRPAPRQREHRGNSPSTRKVNVKLEWAKRISVSTARLPMIGWPAPYPALAGILAWRVQ
jgi:hypothetical protein